VNTSKKSYLYEVQGLRTLAALMVAFYHIWFQRVSGGVDVFFVISAFFMALSLTKVDNLDWSSVSHYYMNTIRRVLPNTVIVIVFSTVGLLMLSPSVVWRGEIFNAIGSALFVENLVLAFKSKNYLDQGLNSSIFQQMWAISIQMQLYFTIPIIIYIVSVVCVQKRIDFKQTLLKVFILIFIFSLSYSVFRTSINQPFTYYDTLARVWEFSIGILLAMMLSKIRYSNKVSTSIGLFGLVVLVSFAAVFDVSTQFPGYLALVPCLAACAVVISSSNGSTLPIISSKIFIKLGDYSFGFYLWHWPLLTLYRQYFGIDKISVIAGIVIIFSALFLSILSTKFAEKPFRDSISLKASVIKTIWAVFGLVCITLISISMLVFSWNSSSNKAFKELASFMKSNSLTTRSDLIYPSPVIARRDLPSAYSDGCHQNLRDDNVISCSYGDKASSKFIILAGGSHSTQWLPALKKLGFENGFKVINMTKSGCVLTSSYPGQAASTTSISSCMRWNSNVINEIIKLQPQAVFTIGTRVVNGDELVPSGYADVWRQLNDYGIDVVAIRDNPWFDFDVPACVAVNINIGSCSIPRKAYYNNDNPLDAIESENVYSLDLATLLCSDYCLAVIDNILVYRDKHHLTKTFVFHNRHVFGSVLKDIGLIVKDRESVNQSVIVDDRSN
jgi:peptidoglycan/LPS O-acetylase OafA/YrhL